MDVRVSVAMFVALVVAWSVGPAAARAAADYTTPGATAVLSPVSGPLSAAPTFGRDALDDVFDGAHQRDLANFTGFFAGGFRAYTPFAGTAQTAFGTIAASGVAVHTVVPSLISPLARTLAGQPYDVRDFLISARLMPGFAMRAGYNLDMASGFSLDEAISGQLYGGLFFSEGAARSSYFGLTASGNFVGATLRLADDLQFHIGAASMAPQSRSNKLALSALSRLQARRNDLQRAEAAEAGVTWKFSDWGGLGLTASQTTERGGLLGGVDSSGLAMTRSAKTEAVGLSANFGLGGGWVTTFSYDQGVTQLNLRSNGILTGIDALHRRAYGVAVAKHGLFSKSDTLGFTLTRPVEVYHGALDVIGAAVNGIPGSSLDRVSLAGTTPETDVELGYVTTFFDGALALQANAGYQMNLAGQKGTNSVTVLSRAKINF